MGFSNETSIDYLNQVIDFCWEKTIVYGSGYPAKVWQRSGLDDMIRSTLFHEDDELLIWREGSIKAVTLLFVEANQQYLQTIGGIYSDDLSEAVDQLLAYRDTVHPGFELLIGYPDTPAIREVFNKRGRLIEAATFYEAKPQPGVYPVHRVTKAEFQELSPVHDLAFSDIYWTSDRLLEQFEEWVVVREDLTNHYSFSRIYEESLGEIFGLSEPTDLLIHGTKSVLADFGVNRIIASADQGDRLNDSLRNTGFLKTGDYICYRF